MISKIICYFKYHEWKKIDYNQEGVDLERVNVRVDRCSRCKLHRKVLIFNSELYEREIEAPLSSWREN